MVEWSFIYTLMIKVIGPRWTLAWRSRSGERYFVARSTHCVRSAFFAKWRASHTFFIGVSIETRSTLFDAKRVYWNVILWFVFKVISISTRFTDTAIIWLALITIVQSRQGNTSAVAIIWVSYIRICRGAIELALLKSLFRSSQWAHIWATVTSADTCGVNNFIQAKRDSTLRSIWCAALTWVEDTFIVLKGIPIVTAQANFVIKIVISAHCA